METTALLMTFVFSLSACVISGIETDNHITRKELDELKKQLKK